MLQRLALEEFVLFDAAALEFGPGLNVLTGETGAGKSILIDALGLIAGGRASAEWIRPGAERLSVEAIFDLGSSPQTFLRQLEDSGVRLDESHLLALRRELSRDGRSRTFANGRSVLVSDLRAWAPYLLRLVCQGDARDLESSAVLEALLDREAGTTAEAQSYREERHNWKRAEDRRRELREEAAALRREEDWLRFQREEIRAANVRPSEREELADRLRQERVRQASTALLEETRARIAREEGSVLDHLETLAHRFRAVELPDGALGEPPGAPGADHRVTRGGARGRAPARGRGGGTGRSARSGGAASSTRPSAQEVRRRRGRDPLAPGAGGGAPGAARGAGRRGTARRARPRGGAGHPGTGRRESGEAPAGGGRGAGQAGQRAAPASGHVRSDPRLWFRSGAGGGG
ncbi:MAG: AAA family ATPase [Candidatus Eisenbacteria bacterium]|nr:AAA family ATPase [Candidatus Eisenbacteria bacterium]